MEDIKVKNSKIKSKKLNEFLTFEEKQILLRKLMKNGLTFEESKKRINNLISQLIKTKTKIKNHEEKEKQIKLKKMQLLEELWNY